MDQLAQDNRLAALYDLWYRQRDEIFKTYSSKPSERLPLSQNPEFKAIRNAVVKEAAKLIEVQQLSAPVDSAHNEYVPSAVPQVLTLMRQAAQVFQDRFRDLDDQRQHRVDRKLQSKIAEKKLAQGQKLGG